jgi:site-specific DNA-methyltransferase (adenine-specific)
MLNTITQGNCLDLIKTIPDNFVDLICTDPPYLINYKTNHRKDKAHDFCSEIANDAPSDASLFEQLLPEYYRVLKDNTALYLFTSSKTIDIFKPLVEKAGFNIKNLIIWVKNNWTAGDLKNQYGQQYEIIIYANKGLCPIRGKRIPDVWNFDRVAGEAQIHQNQKPVPLLKQIILNSSDINNVVLDTFGGSCSLAEAAVKTGRKYIVFEINETYVKNAKIKFAFKSPFRVY